MLERLLCGASVVVNTTLIPSFSALFTSGVTTLGSPGVMIIALTLLSRSSVIFSFSFSPKLGVGLWIRSIPKLLARAASSLIPARI